MKHIIIGNGIIALTTAFKLLDKLAAKDELHIIGPLTRNGSATFAAPAMLNSFAEIEAHSLQSPANRYYFDMSLRATQLWPDFGRELKGRAESFQAGKNEPNILLDEYIQTGTYVVNNSASDQIDDANFDAIVRALEKFEEPFDFVEPRAIPSYHPAEKSRAIRAILIHNEGWLNPRDVIEKIETILRRDERVVFIDASVERLVTAGHSIQSVKLDNKEHICGDIFLLSNGASIGKILEKSDLGLNIQPVFYGVGLSLEIKSPGLLQTNCVRTPNRGGACGIYVVPYFNGSDQTDSHLMIGTSNFLSNEPFHYGRVISISHLMAGAINEINGHLADAQLVRVNVGWRPVTQDTYPLLGKTSIGNLVLATGTRRNGFHLSPLISEMISSIMIGGSVEKKLSIFAPERNIMRELNREEAIKLGVDHLMSQHHQHGYRPSGIRMDAEIRAAFKSDIEKIHDQVDATDWGIHPELLNMYKRGFAH